MLRQKNSLTNEIEFPKTAEIVKLPSNESINQKLETKKIDSNSKVIEIKEHEDVLLFFISVDGSQHSEVALDVVTEEFFKKDSKLVVMHIYNNKWDHIYNYRNKKETVMSYYATKASKFGKRANFVVEDRKEESVHSLEQVSKLSYYFKANYLVSGYYGIKGPKGDNNELSKGVNYLLGSSMGPTIIFKDTPLRSKKPNKGYNWLVVMDRQYKMAPKAFEAFTPLMDPEKDFVYGLTLSETYMNSEDEFKDPFMKEIENKEIKNYDYEFLVHSRATSQVVATKVNYGEINFDFVVFFNNRDKYRVDGANSDSTNIVKNCSCSICFLNC
jgi:hypothetical protein